MATAAKQSRFSDIPKDPYIPPPYKSGKESTVTALVSSIPDTPSFTQPRSIAVNAAIEICRKAKQSCDNNLEGRIGAEMLYNVIYYLSTGKNCPVNFSAPLNAVLGPQGLPIEPVKYPKDGE